MQHRIINHLGIEISAHVVFNGSGSNSEFIITLNPAHSHKDSTPLPHNSHIKLPHSPLEKSIGERLAEVTERKDIVPFYQWINGVYEGMRR